MIILTLKCVIVLLLFIASSSSQYSHSCGIGGKPSGLIVNGTQSNRGAWPWLVSIYKIQGNQLMCGGSLVSADTVITAAHCIQEKRQEYRRTPNEIVIKIGRYDLAQIYERDAIDAYAYEIFVHPNWKFYTHDYDSDIAIIKLTSPVIFNDVIFPICMWSSNRQPTETSGFIVGYGKSENVNIIHEFTPRELQVIIQSNENCFLRNSRLALISSHNTFCAGKDAYSGACNGDSGGGLYIQYNNIWYLRGIISASLVDHNRCDTTNFAIYTNVLNFREWINQILNAKNHRIPPINQNVATINNNNNNNQVNVNTRMPNKKEIVCFIARWAIWRKNGGKFSIEDLKPELCTTIVYYFAGIDDDGNLKSLSPNVDLEENRGLNGFKRVTALKQLYPHLRVLLAVGGWSEGVEKFSKLAADPVKSKHFAVQSADFLNRYGFDGMNLYWDFPGDKSRGGLPQDKTNYGLLLREIGRVYRKQKMYLSTTMRTLKWMTDQAYNFSIIAPHVNAINLITFDYSGAWNKKIEYSAALRANENQRSVEAAVKMFTDAGIPANKLILGIAFYARTFATTQDGDIGNDSEVESFAGPFLDNKLILGYNEICRLKQQYGWYTKFDTTASQVVGKFIHQGKVNVAVYDSQRSVANKVKFAIEKNLRGVWAWSVDTDDFLGECEVDITTYDDFGKKRPEINYSQDFKLLRTMNDVMKFYKKI